MVLLRAPNLLAGFILIGLALSAADEARAQLQTPARQSVILDYDTGEVLFCKECDVPMPPSSMAKLMTVELVFQRIKDGRLSVDDTFRVSEFAWREQFRHPDVSLTWVAINSDVTVDTLLKGIIVQSGGDACIVVAEALGGSEEGFAQMLNRRAVELGLTNSNFVNSTGMPDPNEYMSALDIANLSAHIIREYPVLYEYFAIPEFTWSDIRQFNRNRLLFMNMGADGLKTGHTAAAGYGIVASAEQNGRRMIVVVNGMESEAARNNEAARLINFAFREFRTYQLVEAGDGVTEVEVWGGARPTVPVTVTEPLRASMTPEARAQMRVTLRYDGPVPAPIQAGQQIGTLTLSVPGRPDRTVRAVAAESVAQIGILGRMWLGLRALIASPGAQS